MLVYQIMARLSSRSRKVLRDIMATCPTELDYFPVEVFASIDPLPEIEVERSALATTLGVVSPFDEATSSSPSILLLDSSDLRDIHDQIHAQYAWPYEFNPYMRLTAGSLPRRRYITAFMNSISDTLTRNPVSLEFDSFFTTASEFVTPPFQDYFGDFRLMR